MPSPAEEVPGWAQSLGAVAFGLILTVMLFRMALAGFGRALAPEPPPARAAAITGAWVALPLVALNVLPLLFAAPAIDDGAPFDVTTSLVAAVLLNGVLVGGALLYARRVHGEPPRAFGWRAPRLADLGFALAAAVAFVPAFHGATILNARVVASLGLEQHQALVQEFLERPDLLVHPLVLLNSIVIVPCLEEALFRGVLQRSLRAVLPPGAAITVAALFFGAVHDPQSILPVFVLGMLLGAVAERTGTIASSTLLHSLFNGGMILMIRHQAAGGG